MFSRYQWGDDGEVNLSASARRFFSHTLRKDWNMKKNFAVLLMATAVLAVFGVSEAQAVGGFSYSRTFKDFSVKVESPNALGIAPVLDAVEDDAHRTRVEALLKKELENRYKNKEVHVETTSSSPVKAQTINGALNHHASFDTNVTARTGEVTSRASLYPTVNGVISTLIVKAGQVRLEGLGCSLDWEVIATKKSGASSCYAFTGYPGYYGARAVCVSKKCKYLLDTYLLE